MSKYPFIGTSTEIGSSSLDDCQKLIRDAKYLVHFVAEVRAKSLSKPTPGNDDLVTIHGHCYYDKDPSLKPAEFYKHVLNSSSFGPYKNLDLTKHGVANLMFSAQPLQQFQCVTAVTRKERSQKAIDLIKEQKEEKVEFEVQL